MVLVSRQLGVRLIATTAPSSCQTSYGSAYREHAMPVDNRLYDREGDIWWSEDQPLSMLRTMLNPVRFAFFRDELIKTMQMDVIGRRVLDVGCGGGLLTEE